MDRSQLIEAAKIIGKAFQEEAAKVTDDGLQREFEVISQALLNRRLITSIIPKG